MCPTDGIQRFEGWNIIRTIPRVTIPVLATGFMVISEGVIDISEDVLDGGSNVEVVGEGQTAGIIIALAVVVHGKRWMVVVVEQEGIQCL